VPDAIRNAPTNEITIKSVQASPKAYLKDQVRWGGNIISVNNKPTETWVEVLARPLDYEGEPNSEAANTGRFIARINGFLDPAIYTTERKITVQGQLENTIVRLIDEHPYRFPLVQAKTHYLWPKPPEIIEPWRDPWYPYYPYRYDPFYDSRLPYYGDPYFPHPRGRHRR
jgi:outer membrane lipoprotein